MPRGRLGSTSTRLLLAFVCIAGSCTTTSGGAEDPGAGVMEVAQEFVAAWNARDYELMNSLMTTASYLPADDLRGQMNRVLRSGRFTSVKVNAVAPSPAPDGNESAPQSVPYQLVMESSAARRPVLLDGELELSFEDAEGSWRVDWNKRLLFPGFEGAAGYAVEDRWLKRGSILDRDKRKLATGQAGSRRYPFGSTAGATVGHIGPATQEQALELKVSPGELVGASGLEEGLQELLAGRPASTLSVVDRKGKPIEVLGRFKGRPGRNIKTTLDIEVQRVTQAAFGGIDGGAVVMDPRTGGLLAVVSSSPFNPNGYVGAAGVHPFNRAIEGLYPPGSAMKVVTASAALDTKTVTPTTRLTGPASFQGVTNFESGEFGSLSFASAVQFSVNTAFAQVALKLGPKRLTEYADAFGFNRVPDMPLEAAESSFPFPDDQGDLMWGSIGQAQVLATPLQMATVAATVANDGKRMEPRIASLGKPSGEQVMTRATAKTMTELMINVVVGGTGQAARLAGLDVAGKTGTAEVDVGGERKNHAWFICFAPADDPDIAVAVVSEYGGIGGQVAAPIARQILASSLLIIQADEFRADQN